ncbi:MAG: NusG domain II-containing protein [Lachnospiraceae bacterium]|nr:NusG domain II-containing protein [Lachnospiraceae bacterium]
MKEYVKRGDLVILIGVLVLSGLLYVPLLFSRGGTVAEVLSDGEVVERIDLDSVNEPYTIKIRGSVILVEPGKIGYLESDCPNGECVRFGMLSRAGAAAACVPNRTMIRILSANREKDGPDAVTY